MANRKPGKIEKVGNLGKIIPSFLISEFSILPYNQNRKLGFKNIGKKFPRFPRFPSFRPGLNLRMSRCMTLNYPSLQKTMFFLFINLDFIVFVSTNRLYLSFKGLNTKDPYTHCFNQPCFEKNTRFSRGNHHWCSVRKGVLRNFAKFAGNNCVAVSLNKVAVPGVTSFDSFNC